MNVFKTVPVFLVGYIQTLKYNSYIPKLKRLREEGNIEEEKALIQKGQREWIETIARKGYMSFEVTGEENIPDKGPFMVYSNHQSFADIFSMLWLFKDHCQIGFVAKEEWRKYKIVADAITYTRSIFLVRDNPREAVKAVNEAKELFKQGFNLVIYPEGTRSKGHKMGEFKAAAFKFAEKGNVPILPVTLDGGYKLFEEKGTYQHAHVKITVHPLVHIEEMSRQEQKQAAADIEAEIRAALDN